MTHGPVCHYVLYLKFKTFPREFDTSSRFLEQYQCSKLKNLEDFYSVIQSIAKKSSKMNIFLHRALKISSKLHQTHLLDTLKKFNLLPPPALLLRAHIRGQKIKGQICQTDNIVYLLFIYWIINAAKIELSFYHGLRPFRSDWYIYKILAEFLCHQLRAFS